MNEGPPKDLFSAPYYSQMIAEDKTWILLYKDCVLSHSTSLEDKQIIYVEGVDIPWFHGIINHFSLRLVCPKAFLC